MVNSALRLTVHLSLQIGLVEPRTDETGIESEPDIVRLHEFLAELIQDRKTASGETAAAATVRKWKTTESCLKQHFGNVNIASITPGDARTFRQWLENKRTGRGQYERLLSLNTRRKHISITKQFFNAAVRLDLIEKNPFQHETSSKVFNRDRDFFVDRDMTNKLLQAAPDDQWRLMIALWRLAGLRKMEVFALNWSDILWDQGRMLVRSSKTAHHGRGRAERFVPVGAVEKYLSDVFHAAADEAQSGSAAVITRFSRTNVNLHKPFRRIVENAGLVT